MTGQHRADRLTRPVCTVLLAAAAGCGLAWPWALYDTYGSWWVLAGAIAYDTAMLAPAAVILFARWRRL
jgi:hypothetical protein